MKKIQCFFAVVLIGWTISFMGCQKASHNLEPVSADEETSVR